MNLKQIFVIVLLLSIIATISKVHGAETKTFEVTAYCGCAKCCGKAGQPTASGKMPKQGVTIAAPRSIPLGTKVHIKGVGDRIVQDRLAKRYDHRIDIYFNSHKEALLFGKQKKQVILN